MPQQALPSFERPPVVETVAGVQFAPLDWWEIAHFGLLWDIFREDFPVTQSQPALNSIIESFEDRTDSPIKRQNIEMRIANVPQLRCWYVSKDEHDLLQVQRDRFLFNWRQNNTNTEYPRFQKYVKPRFKEYWNRFLDFIKEQKKEVPKVIQCEMTYVNHIDTQTPNGKVEWTEILRILSQSPGYSFLPRAESTNLVQSFLFKEDRIRLRIKANPAFRITDQTEILVLEFHALGKPISNDAASVEECLDKCRACIVRSFADVTTDQIQKEWIPIR